MLKKNIAVLGIALGIMAFGAPAAASAVEDPYVLPASVSIDDAVITQCETSTIVFGARYWVGGETVQVAASGARVGGATFTPSVSAAADGSLSATFLPPRDGEGVYDITFTSATQSYTAPITVTAVAHCEADPQADDQALAFTGGGTSPWIYGIGGGLLVAGSALITVTVLRRRQA